MGAASTHVNMWRCRRAGLMGWGGEGGAPKLRPALHLFITAWWNLEKPLHAITSVNAAEPKIPRRALVPPKYRRGPEQVPQTRLQPLRPPFPQPPTEALLSFGSFGSRDLQLCLGLQVWPRGFTMETPRLHGTRNSCKTGPAIVGPHCEAGSEATPGQHKLLQPAKEASRLPQRRPAWKPKSSPRGGLCLWDVWCPPPDSRSSLPRRRRGAVRATEAHPSCTKTSLTLVFAPVEVLQPHFLSARSRRAAISEANKRT